MAKLDLGDLKDLKELKALKDIDLTALVDTFKSMASDRADSLFNDGRSRARKAVGGHDDGALFASFSVGILVGALIGAAVALLMTPLSGMEARRKLSESVDKVRGGSNEPESWSTAGGNGRTASNRSGSGISG